MKGEVVDKKTKRPFRRERLGARRSAGGCSCSYDGSSRGIVGWRRSSCWPVRHRY
jgi:hypothetical protein